MSADATSEPARGPSPAAQGSAGAATIGAITVSTPAAAMTGASTRDAPNRSAMCPPSQ